MRPHVQVVMAVGVKVCSGLCTGCPSSESSEVSAVRTSLRLTARRSPGAHDGVALSSQRATASESVVRSVVWMTAC